MATERVKKALDNISTIGIDAFRLNANKIKADKTYTGAITQVLFTTSTDPADPDYCRYEVGTDGGFYQPQILDGRLHAVGEKVKVYFTATGKCEAEVISGEITAIHIHEFNEGNTTTVDFSYSSGEETISNAVCSITIDETAGTTTFTFADHYGEQIIVNVEDDNV